LPRLEKTKTAQKEFSTARDAFLNSSKMDQHHTLLEEEAAKLGVGSSAWADAALLKIESRKNTSPEVREAATRSTETGWTEPKRKAQLLRAAGIAMHRDWRDRILAALDDPNSEVASAAKQAASDLRLKREARKSTTQTLEK